MCKQELMPLLERAVTVLNKHRETQEKEEDVNKEGML